MATEGSKGSPDRTQTDASLRSERQNIDRVLAERQAAVDDAADEIVDTARDTADSVLLAAREKADERPAQQPPTARVTAERAAEDEALRDERAVADESLRREREENARALLMLLPHERDSTDRYLLTERVRSDDALANRDDFLGIVSHDLRDLLGGIVMAAGLMSKKAPESEDGAYARLGAERIQRYAARMNRLIGDLVDVASIDAGKLAVSRARADAAALIAEAVDTFQAPASAKEITLTMEVAEPALPADFDHDRMLQVLANLIANSIKFTPAGGTIRVGGGRAAGALRLFVSDSGPGIPPDLLEAVFERFRQVAENDRRGLGLGLYISKHLVEAHGGRMAAESTPGNGTTIWFTIPPAAE
jgi:signal transduction histidine kinase